MQEVLECGCTVPTIVSHALKRVGKCSECGATLGQSPRNRPPSSPGGGPRAILNREHHRTVSGSLPVIRSQRGNGFSYTAEDRRDRVGSAPVKHVHSKSLSDASKEGTPKHAPGAPRGPQYRFIQSVVSSKVIKFQAVRYDDIVSVALTWREVLDLWQEQDSVFYNAFSEAMSSSQARDVFLECAPVKSQMLSSQFEFVLLDAEGSLCNREANALHFAQYIDGQSSRQVVSIPNPRGDATFVLPTHQPQTRKDVYAHISSFFRGAGDPQKLQLWRMVGEIVAQKVAENPDKPTWVSTDGRGAPWVSIRVDKIPKYIKHGPYKWNTG